MSWDWGKIAKVVGKSAPLLGTALGGPAGATIGAMVANVLGVDDNPDAVAKAIEKDPEALLKLKEFEYNNEQHIREYAFKVLDAELKDKQNARGAHKDSSMPAVITVMMTVLAVLYGLGLFFLEIPEENKDMANYFGGQLIALWFASVVYWVGTTRSSSDKNKMIAKGVPGA